MSIQVEIEWQPHGTKISWRGSVIGEHSLKLAYEALMRHQVADTLEEARECVANLRKSGAEVSEIIETRIPGETYPPKAGGLEETAGSFNEDGLIINFGGACPVQGEGTIDGCFCYYHSRGTSWAFEVWHTEQSTGDPIWSIVRNVYVWPDGGWIHRDESEVNLRLALKMWKAR